MRFFYSLAVRDKFDWDAYLENRNVAPVPNFAFQHVS